MWSNSPLNRALPVLPWSHARTHRHLRHHGRRSPVRARQVRHPQHRLAARRGECDEGGFAAVTQYHNFDESGDPGLSRSAHSSSHLVLAMVQLPERGPLPELTALRQILRLPPNFEFKFHKSTELQKEAFFAATVPIAFRVRAVVIDKSGLPPRFRSLHGAALVGQFLVALALRASPLDIADDILVLDGATPAFRRALRIMLSEACRSSGRIRPFKKIVSGDSSREDGLQLADMIAGAIRRQATGQEGLHCERFASKILDLWHVPEPGK
jgi:hypothetical protein